MSKEDQGKSKMQARNLAKVPREQGEFIRVHRMTLELKGKNGKKLSRTKQFLLEQAFGLSRARGVPQDGRETPKMDRLSENALAKLLNRSKSTVFRSVKELDEIECISRDRPKGSRCMQYEAKIEITGDYYDVDYYLLTTPFEIYGEGERCLTHVEASTFCYIKGHCLNPGGKRSFTCTLESLAAQVNVSEKTMRNAIRILKLVGFLTCPEEDKGKRGKATTYHVDSVFFNIKKRGKKKKTPEQKAAIAYKEQLKGIDDRAERERYYAARKAAAEKISDDNARRAMRDPEYKQVVAALSNATIEAAKKEVLNLSGLSETMETLRALKARKAAILSRMGMTESDFEPQYHCRKCNDTGFMSNGVACECYYQRE